MNGSDCGMFACKFAEYASRRAKINFTQVSVRFRLFMQIWARVGGGAGAPADFEKR